MWNGQWRLISLIYLILAATLAFVFLLQHV
jgi:hypothetical protein